MAIMIPNRITADMRATKGEALTFEVLAGLDNDWYIWYDVGIGNTEDYPDFILIHPGYGMTILEVKDISWGMLTAISKEEFRTASYTFTNPILQARRYVFSIVNDERLTEKVPYSYGVVFPNIYRTELDKPIHGVAIGDIIRNELIVAKEDLSRKTIRTRLQGMTKRARRSGTMAKSTFNSLRTVIDPSIIVPHRLIKNVRVKENEIPAVLDVQQERVAKSIGEGHRLLKGIAGSGKTLIMLYRAKLLVKLHPEWNILFVCWNRSLINYLKQMFDAIELDCDTANVTFSYFSQWAKQMGRGHSIRFPFDVDSEDYVQQYTAIIEQMIGLPPNKRYQAILIDEGQDFEEDYFRLLVKHLDPKTDSLLICYDYAQNIYHKKISWRRLGISAGNGRSLDLTSCTDELRLNYRNTLEITKFAKLIYNDKIPTKDEHDQVSVLTEIKASIARGPVPSVQLIHDRFKESQCVVEWIRDTIAEFGLSYHDFLVIYPGRRLNNFDLEDDFLPFLERRYVPFKWIARDPESKSNFLLSDNTVKISTIQSAKGMDFEAVVVVACDCISQSDAETQLFICATRARKHLLVTTGGYNHYVEKILDYSYHSLLQWHEEG